ncbi:MAG TPA: hypothetical protein PKZ16_01130 [bacterium]|nr:hypothetical protein [bacterium]HPL95485.1 hypothetical protein [bacterium]
MELSEKIFLYFLIILQTMFMPESSVPVWTAMELLWWQVFFIVSCFANVPVAIIFWPHRFARLIIAQKKMAQFYRQWQNWKKEEIKATINSIKKITDKKTTSLPFLKIMVGWIVVLVTIIATWCKLIKEKAKKSLHHASNRVIDWLRGLGYTGVIIGAGTPLLPGARPGGLAAALILGTKQAKLLFILCEELRILCEAYLCSLGVQLFQ